jgi:hypothetical protein
LQLFLFVSAKAQDNTGFHFAGGARVALPIGAFSNTHSFGIGAELQGEYGFSENLTGVISAGYTSYMGKTVGGFKFASLGAIPVLAGVRFYPSTQFFVGAKAGVSFVNNGGGTNFTYEPQVGFNAEKFQVSVGYNGISAGGGTLGSIGASFLYKFN